MNLRPLLLCVALAAAFAAASLALADEARAHPVTGLVPHSSHAYHGGVSVGFGVAVPVGPRRHYRPAPVPVRRGGYWAVREHRVWVSGELIGYDAHGHPVYTEGFWTVETQRVWVPAPRRGYVHVRGHRRGHHRGHGHVSFGVGFYR